MADLTVTRLVSTGQGNFSVGYYCSNKRLKQDPLAPIIMLDNKGRETLLQIRHLCAV